MKTVGLLVIHGMGTEREDFDVPFKKGLFRRLRQMGRDPERIAYGKVFWSAYVNERQRKYVAASRMPPNRLDWMSFRNFVMHNLSDAASYQRQRGQDNKNYNLIVRIIQGVVRHIRGELGSDDKPLVIAAHSLGCFVISNYIWDAHKMYAGQPAQWPEGFSPAGKFEHMVNTSAVITFGCNIPLFVIGHDPVEAVRFPHPDLADEYKANAQWHNFYDPDDILGWPLKTLPYSLDGVKQPADASPIRTW